MAFNLEPSANSGKLNGDSFLSEKSERLIPIDKLLEWSEQPFKPYTEEALRTLAASISTNGLLSPIIVRPEGDKFRIISGHNRAKACRLLGWTDIMAVVKDTDDNHAKLMMLDTNLCQRQALSPSELIRAYRAQYEVLSEIAGKGYGVQKKIAEQYSLNRKTISRYLKCASLSNAVLDLLDEGRLTLRSAEYLAGLSEGNQAVLVEWLSDKPTVEITDELAKQIAEQDRYGLDNETLDGIILDKKPKCERKPADVSAAAEQTAEEQVESIPQETQPVPIPAADNALSAPADERSAADDEGYVVAFTHDEVKQTIGEISQDELGEYFFYCLQRDDIISEWLDVRKQDEERMLLDKGASPY